MTKSRLFLCSGALAPAHLSASPNCKVISLSTQGPAANVNLVLEDVARILNEDLSPRLLDLLEIAAYVYAADASTSRSGAWQDDHTTEPWDRSLQFVIPVRDLSFWQENDVKNLLGKLLNFLSDDDYTLEFCKLTNEPLRQLYLSFGDQDDWPFHKVERVLMFSGGLDSLAGAVETAAAGQKLVLVSHRPVATLDARQRNLFKQLKAVSRVPMIHVPVWVNKEKGLGREHTQRSRSFLYSALGTVIAESVQADGVRFFENGIVSLNLPVADEVLRARASRTTHPHTIYLLTKLYSLVTNRDLIIDNPYIFKTKADVAAIIATHNASGLIQNTCSCAHTGFFQSKTQWHCGTCSQCIDRRIALLATQQGQFDLETDYVADVFTGARKDGPEKNMAVDFVRHSLELYHMSEAEIVTKFDLELSRATRHCPQRREAAQAFVEMHKRHAIGVFDVLTQQLQQHAAELLQGKLSKNSLLALTAGQQHLDSSWKHYSDRIAQLLRGGVPKACMTHKPQDEPHLQQICDGILQGRNDDLTREFPFMRWSSSFTKPDWSVEPLRFWVELKYVRKKGDIRQITKDIAEDITKYGDNDRRVLYVVYDPDHFIEDDNEFVAPIIRRPTMWVEFIR